MSSSSTPGESAGRHTGVAASPGGDLPADETLEQATSQADAGTGPPADVAALRQEIEQTREQLGATIEQLAAKADIKAQARDKAGELAGAVKSKTALARAEAAARARSVRDQLAAKAGGTGAAANQAANSARQQAAKLAGTSAAAWQATPEPVRQAVTKAASSARRHRDPIAAAAGLLLLGSLLRRCRRRQ